MEIEGRPSGIRPESALNLAPVYLEGETVRTARVGMRNTLWIGAIVIKLLDSGFLILSSEADDTKFFLESNLVSNS